jgi:hypothetical protein
MPVGEIFVKLAVGFDEDPKVVALAKYGDDAGLCRDLYLAMVRYCRRNLTDGLVPEFELMRLAFPLALPRALPLAQHLAAEELITQVATGWIVNAYVKRNGTRADVEAKIESQRELARRRWKNGGHSPARAIGNAGGNATATRLRMPESESESENPRATRTPARGGTRQPPPASEVLGTHYAPSSDPNERAAEARRQLAERDRPLNAAPDPAPALGGEALARAQLAQARAARLPEIEAAAVDGDEPPAEQPPDDEYPF